MRHPCLCQAGINFVPNDIRIGEYEGYKNTPSNIMMLTGSNMGGKSTILRMSCIAAIIA